MKILRIVIIALIVITVSAFFYFTLDKDPQALLLNSLEERKQHYLWIVLVIFGLTVVSTATGLPVLYLGVALGFFMPYFSALSIAWGINLIAILATYLMVKRVLSLHSSCHHLAAMLRLLKMKWERLLLIECKHILMV